MANIMVLGAGGFGISLAVTLNKYGHNVCMWSAVPSEIEEIRLHGENRKLLPGIAVDFSIELTTAIEKAKDCELIIFAVASKFVREVALKVKPYVTRDTILVNVAKGFEESTMLHLSQVIQSELPNNDVVVLSGPSHAEEIARGVPTTIVAACKNRASAQYVQDVMMNTNLRVYVNDDILGVELGGALKNIIAVCAGICDGMNLGDNTKAALMTRGLAEIARLGTAMGAQSETFTGLTGVGDLIVTCMSMHSRNRRCGIFIGQGLSSEDAIARVGMTVEGCAATKVAYQLSKKYNVDMPIVAAIYSVLYENKDIQEAVRDLMGRPKRHESEHIWMSEKSKPLVN
ncbi:NAD(P)H-dependent glycerol-3-phosphate dehydrogenase [Paludicola sp. MB14-C6]|uniref:NAD(P)H-dependent glycerol-3-phosphate dehydrogenase n=1 Tax=Paludihabitans sp. MB14-C6 TaxID=3070656 RepID=UPI0027DDDFA8|nr:NAD(P)H-dependent glycerol-3-phosphate dehydrogenase [Paludicola sp. MB14-C6]WMJ22797.1 NAD(P)H-dependent glycerol-3-phosphate dehydrogenase [Paludicola sp. MB14-C6]